MIFPSGVLDSSQTEMEPPGHAAAHTNGQNVDLKSDVMDLRSLHVCRQRDESREFSFTQRPGQKAQKNPDSVFPLAAPAARARL